jgi:hypothetical protein
MDRLLRETFRSRATSQQRELSTPKHPERVPQPENWTQSRAVQPPIPPLLKVYWALCAGLLLVVIQQGCQWHREADSGLAGIQTSLIQPDASAPVNEQPANRVQTWVREDEPSIEITGPVFANPYQDWAPRAVLERIPAARAELVSSSVPRAELVRLPQ